MEGFQARLEQVSVLEMLYQSILNVNLSKYQNYLPKSWLVACFTRWAFASFFNKPNALCTCVRLCGVTA
jgi:hypothetical protein